MEIGEFSSSSVSITCGVPQGSILGPILFSLYLLPLRFIFESHKVSYHIYADDTQLYFPLKSGSDSVSSLLACLEDIKNWMENNFLQLNQNKTEVILFGPSHLLQNLRPTLGPLEDNICEKVKNLGVIFDPELKFDKQINSVVRTSFLQLRGLRKLKSFLSFNDLEVVIHAFISIRLDYCNSLYAGINQFSLSRLQLVQNAAARFLTGTKKREPLTPVLASLHWLPVKF